MYYPPAIRENASSSSKAKDASGQTEDVGPNAALAITSSKEPAEERGPSGATKTDEGQNPDAPQETIRSIGDAPVSLAEGPVLLIEPLQSVPLGEGFKDLDTSPAQLSEARAEAKSKNRPPRVALVLYLL